MTKDKRCYVDYVLVCRADSPTNESRPYVRNLRNCLDITEAMSKATCDILENTSMIQEITDNYCFNVEVYKKGLKDESRS